MPITPDEQARITEITAHFEHMQEQQLAMHLRVARRTTGIIRVGAISLVVVGISMLLLLLTLAYQIKPIIKAVDTMNAHFSGIAGDMSVMKGAILEMRSNVSQVRGMAEEMTRMSASVDEVNATLGQMALRMDTMETNMAGITRNVARMSATFGVMNQTLDVMGNDVGRMSSPVRIFNWMNPAD